jgi:hypothetical protein
MRLTPEQLVLLYLQIGPEIADQFIEHHRALEAERDVARGEALLSAGDWFLNWCDRAGVKVEESAIRQGLAYLPGQEALCGTAVNVDISTNKDTRPIVKDAWHSEERPLLPDQEWKQLSLESQNKVRKWFDLAAKYLQAILDERIDPDILALDPSAVKAAESK